MTNRRVVKANSPEDAVEEFVKMGFDKDCILTVWQEVLTSTVTVKNTLRKIK